MSAPKCGGVSGLPEAAGIAQWLAQAPPPLDFVLPGFLRGTVGALVSPGGVGKSYWALSLALAVAGGARYDLTGLAPAQGRVVFLNGEDPEVIVARRLRAAVAALGLAPGQWAPLLESLDIRNVLESGPLEVTRASTLEALIELAAGARLVVFDTLTRFHALDENSAQDMKAVMGALERLAHESGAAVLFLHHTSKAAVLGGTGALQQAARGSSVLTDNARWAAFLAPMTEAEARAAGVTQMAALYAAQHVRWNISKQNYGPPLTDKWYRRNNEGVLVPQTRNARGCVVPESAPARAGETDLVVEVTAEVTTAQLPQRVPHTRAVPAARPRPSAQGAFGGRW